MILRGLWLTLLSSNVYTFQLVREYSGSSFFDRWEFYGSFDNLTNGDVIWVDKDTAFSQNLVGVNSAQNAIIKVDNSSNVPFNFKRDSVRITSTDSYDFGSLWIFDIVHLPWGCSVWPAVWTKGVNGVNEGEVDIVEGVNLMTQNQMVLHTDAGCIQTPGLELGTPGANPDCSTGTGCTVRDTTSQASFGQPFAQAGGGIWATQFDVAGVFIWFWNRTDIPQSLKSSGNSTNLDISDWGTPVASYLPTNCNMTQFFGPQQLVIDITLCGGWAGLASEYNQTCANEQPNAPTPQGAQHNCYVDNVWGPGSPRYDDAYFEISNIRAYTTGVPNPMQTLSPSPTSGSSAGAVTVNINGTAVTVQPNTEIPNANLTSGGARTLAFWSRSGIVAVFMGLVMFYW